tara:strand:- start:956 stop:1120 length:165 start_codon:yes stop_codon:yes gene_type:complete
VKNSADFAIVENEKDAAKIKRALDKNVSIFLISPPIILEYSNQNLADESIKKLS